MDENLEQRLQQIQKALGKLNDGQGGHRSALVGVRSEIEALGRQMRQQSDDLQAGQRELSTQLTRLGSDLEAFSQRTRRDVRHLSAQLGLVDLRAELDRLYGRHKAIRDSVRGVLNLLDNGYVQQETLQLAVQFKAIELIDYWLAAMLNATVVWALKDNATMEAALRGALALDPGKTALFAGLLNARYHRLEDTEIWFTRYLQAQKETQLPEDFAVVLDSALAGVLGTPTFERIARRVLEWHAEQVRRPELTSVQEQAWERELAGRVPRAGDPVGDFEETYPVLTRVAVSSQWPALARNLGRAGSFAVLARTIPSADRGAGASPDGRRAQIDTLMDNLCRLAEPGEREMRLQVLDLLRMSDPDADEPTLTDGPEAPVILEERKTDLLTLMSRLAMHPERYDVSPRTIQFATYIAKDWIATAIRKLREESAAQLPARLPIQIEGWSGEIGEGADAPALERRLRERMDRDIQDEETRERRFRDRFLLFGGSAIALLLWVMAMFSGVRFGSYRGLTLLGLFFAFGLVGAAVQFDAPRRVRAVRTKHVRRRDEAVLTLHAAIRAHEHLVEQWNERLRVADELGERIAAIALPEETLALPPRPEDSAEDSPPRRALRDHPRLKPRDW